MYRLRLTASILGVLTFVYALQSCNDDHDSTYLWQPTALVTVRPATDDGGFTLQLDDKTTLYPSNMKNSPYGDKEVRALVNYVDESGRGDVRSVRINWMDSIRTKNTTPSLGLDNDAYYGNDPIEIVKDWVTVAEDGYLTLRIRTRWGHRHIPHYIYLLTGVNPDNPYELELRHNAQGDVGGMFGDALVAFNLNDLPRSEGDNVKIKVNWKSFSGKKSAEFSLQLRSKAQNVESFEGITYNQWVK